MLRVQVWDAENGEGVAVELDPSPLAVVEEDKLAHADTGQRRVARCHLLCDMWRAGILRGGADVARGVGLSFRSRYHAN